MLVRLRDFAEIHRISDRTVQLHIKENWDELQDHVDRRGKQGTWLDEFAVDFLLNRIQLPSKDEVVVPTPREAALLIQIAETNKALAEAERRAGENAEAAGKVKLLEASRNEQELKIAELNMRVGRLTARAEEAEVRAARADETAKIKYETEKNRALTDAHSAFETVEKQKDKKIRELKRYALDRYAADLAAYEQMTKFQRWVSGIKKPEPPVFDDEE